MSNTDAGATEKTWTSDDASSLRNRTRRKVWRTNGTLAAVGAMGVAMLVIFFFTWGDPFGTTATGTIDVTMYWEADGHVSAQIRDESRHREDQSKFGSTIAPALFPDGTQLDVTYPTDKGGNFSVEARSIAPVVPINGELRVDGNKLVRAMSNAGVKGANLDIKTPRVANHVASDIRPDVDLVGGVAWEHIKAGAAPTITVTLEPSPWPQAVAQMLAAILAIGLAVGAVGISIRARRRSWPEPKVGKWLMGCLFLSGASCVVQLFVASRTDQIVVGWAMSPAEQFAAEWIPLLLSLFAGTWAFFGLIASGIRQSASVSPLPPPPPPPPVIVAVSDS